MQVEEELRMSEQQFRTLWETMLQGIVHQDKDGKIISMNPSAERILGKSSKDFLGTTSVDQEQFTIREDGSAFPGLEHPAMVALQTGKVLKEVIMGVYNPREKGYRWINISAVPLFHSGEIEPYQVNTIFHDITELRKADQLKDEFIGMVAHELRTPLTVIKGATYTAMLEGVTPEEKQELFRDAASGVETLENLLNNLLELSRFQANRLVLNPTPIDIASSIEAVFEKLRIKSPIHHLFAEVPPDVPPIVVDPLRIERVLYNLVENAIKYSPHGGDVKVFVLEEDSQLVVGVSDQGLGISSEDQQKLFQRFERVKSFEKYSIPGLGLGLRVYRIMVEAHGGKIWLESEVGKGSTFFFSIPLNSDKPTVST